MTAMTVVRARPTGRVERVADRLGTLALRWVARRAAERARATATGRHELARATERRELAWAAMESRPGR